MRTVIIVAAGLLVLAGRPALCAPRYFDDCTAPDSTVVLRLEACTFSLAVDGLDDKQRVEALLNRSKAYTARWRAWNAEADLEAAKKLAPDDPAISAAIADLALFRTGRQQHAIAEYKDVLKQKGGDPATLIKLGMSYVMADDYASAKQSFDQALNIDPGNVEALIWRSSTYSHAKQYDLALADLDMAVAKQPDNVPARQWRGEQLLYAGAFDKAITDLDLALAGRPLSPFHRYRGIAEYATGKFPAAEADFATDLNIDPVFANLAIWEFFAQQRRGEDSTQAELKRIMGLLQGYWPTPLFKYVLGQTSAEDAIAAAASDDPELQQARQSQAHCIIGEWLLLNGDRAGARSHFQASYDAGVVVATSQVKTRQALFVTDTAIEYALARVRLKELAP